MYHNTSIIPVVFSDKQDPWYDVPAARNKTAIEPETRIESIGEIINVIQYATKEWKSDTATAQAVRAVRYKTFALPYEPHIRLERLLDSDCHL